MKRNPFEFHYRFTFKDGKTKPYPITLHPETLSLIPHKAPSEFADWTKLPFNQCQGCPLEASSHPHCPIAVNIMELVETFKDVLSYHDCLVSCRSIERTYIKQTSVMEGLSSIFGIIMATSDCPVMAFLKPMARFHLPFSTIEETTARTASMFLLAQYFAKGDKAGITCDFTILEDHYARVQRVNEGLLYRINSISSEDADKNAIITLHSLSQFLSMEIDCSLGGLAYIFADAYKTE